MTLQRAIMSAHERGERGFQVCAYIGNVAVVDEWSGHADLAGQHPVSAGTLFPIFSVSKAVTAVAVHLLADRGQLDLEAPIAEIWPEFSVNGKAGATTRHVLQHRLGLPQLPAGVTPDSIGRWKATVDAIADLAPITPPGTRSSYLSMTFGFVLGEIIRRVDPSHREFGRFVTEELCAPLNIGDLHFGLPATDLHRVAVLTSDIPPLEDTLPAEHLRLLAEPPAVGLTPEVFNQNRIHGACIPAVGGISNAQSLARFWALLANEGELDGVRLLTSAAVRGLVQQRSGNDEVDPVLGSMLKLGDGGMWMPDAPAVARWVGRGRVLCHPGAGGSIGWANLDTGVAVAFCHNRMFPFGLPEYQDPWVPIVEALETITSDLIGS